MILDFDIRKHTEELYTAANNLVTCNYTDKSKAIESVVTLMRQRYNVVRLSKYVYMYFYVIHDTIDAYVRFISLDDSEDYLAKKFIDINSYMSEIVKSHAEYTGNRAIYNFSKKTTDTIIQHSIALEFSRLLFHFCDLVSVDFLDGEKIIRIKPVNTYEYITRKSNVLLHGCSIKLLIKSVSSIYYSLLAEELVSPDYGKLANKSTSRNVLLFNDGYIDTENMYIKYIFQTFSEHDNFSALELVLTSNSMHNKDKVSVSDIEYVQRNPYNILLHFRTVVQSSNTSLFYMTHIVHKGDTYSIGQTEGRKKNTINVIFKNKQLIKKDERRFCMSMLSLYM